MCACNLLKSQLTILSFDLPKCLITHVNADRAGKQSADICGNVLTQAPKGVCPRTSKASEVGHEDAPFEGTLRVDLG